MIVNNEGSRKIDTDALDYFFLGLHEPCGSEPHVGMPSFGKTTTCSTIQITAKPIINKMSDIITISF
jgi:hypothetical protein